jgi:hypothetical protein
MPGESFESPERDPTTDVDDRLLNLARRTEAPIDSVDADKETSRYCDIFSTELKRADKKISTIKNRPSNGQKQTYYLKISLGRKSCEILFHIDKGVPVAQLIEPRDWKFPLRGNELKRFDNQFMGDYVFPFPHRWILSTAIIANLQKK